MTALSGCLIVIPEANTMPQFIQIGADNFVNIDKIIRISKVEGRPYPSSEGKFQHKVLGSDGEFHWVGEYSSPFQWVLYTSQEWDGIYRVTNPKYFQGVEDLLNMCILVQVQ